MKKVNLSKFVKLSWTLLIVLGLAFATTSCKDDPDEVDPDPIVLDGVYIKGGSTALTDFDTKGKLKVTRNEVTQADRAQLMEIYIAVKGGAPGFNLVVVAGEVRTTLSPGADFAVVPEGERDTDEPQMDFWRGSYTEISTSEGSAFTVPTDGLYHVVIDTEIKKIAIAPVVWGIIGAATPGGWTNGTELPSTGFDLNTMTFEAKDMTLQKGDFKFRYSNGWKIILDPDYDLGGGEVGIKVNTNYGGSVAALIPGGANISNTVIGKYTAKMVWTLGAGNSATMVKTGDLNIIDYTNTELGLIGNGLIINGVQHNWGDDSTVMLTTPTVENETTYTWTYNNVEITTLGSFKIREGQDWSKKSIGFKDVTMAGLSADKFETNTDGNFVPMEDGTYDMVLKIDAVTETYTFTVNPAGVTTELYMVGDGCSAGWSEKTPLPMEGTGGVYTKTTTLNGTGTAIKFLTTPGQWQPQYGTDATGTSTGGILLLNDGTGSDPDNIPVPDTAGEYLVTVNTNDMTYTIAAAKR